MQFFIQFRLLHLVESGIVKYMLWENLPKAEICPQNLGGTERQLRNGDLLMTYQIMMAGFGTGFIIFLTEVKNENIPKCITMKWLQRYEFKFDRSSSDSYCIVRKTIVQSKIRFTKKLINLLFLP